MRCFTEEFIGYMVAIITGENKPRYSLKYVFYCKISKNDKETTIVITLYTKYNFNQNF